jgi:hypothetical protein
MHYTVNGDTLRFMGRIHYDSDSADSSRYYQDIDEYQVLKLTRDSLWLLDVLPYKHVIRFHNTHVRYDSTLHLKRIVFSIISGWVAKPFRYDVDISRERYRFAYSVMLSESGDHMAGCLMSDSTATFFNQVEDKLRRSIIDSATEDFMLDAGTYSIVVYSNRGRKRLIGTSCGGDVNLLASFLIHSHPGWLRPSDSPCTFETRKEIMPPPQKYSRHPP